MRRSGSSTGFGLMSLAIGVVTWLVLVGGGDGRKAGYVVGALGVAVAVIGMRRAEDSPFSQLTAVAGLAVNGLGLLVIFLEESGYGS